MKTMANNVNSFIICDNVNYSKVHFNRVNHIKYTLLSSLDDNLQECEIVDMDETKLDGLTLALGEKKMLTGATGASIGRNDFPMYKTKNNVSKAETKKALDKLDRMKDIIWDGGADNRSAEKAKRKIYAPILSEITKLVNDTRGFNYDLSNKRYWDKSTVLFNVPDTKKEEIEKSLQGAIDKAERIKKLGTFVLNYQYLQGKRSRPTSQMKGEPPLLLDFKKALEGEILKNYNGPDVEEIKADKVRAFKNGIIIGVSNQLDLTQVEKLTDIAIEEFEREIQQGEYNKPDVEELYKRLNNSENNTKKILVSSEEENPRGYDVILRVDNTLNHKMSEKEIGKYSEIGDVYEFAINLIKIRNLFINDTSPMMKEFDYFRNKIMKFNSLSELADILLIKEDLKEQDVPMPEEMEQVVREEEKETEDSKEVMAEITREIPKNISEFFNIFKKQ